MKTIKKGIEVYRVEGLVGVTRRLLGRLADLFREIVYQILHNLRILAWYVFKLRHKNYGSAPTPTVESGGRNWREWGEIQENNLRTILAGTPGQAFLEVGIGSSPRIQRLRSMLANNVTYTGCDFSSVCERHKKILQQERINTGKMRFLSNRLGTYAWTLMELLRSGDQFDVIYLDGHHTFYVDLPAVMLCHFLLKPGGYFLLDDIFWTLNFMKRQLYNMPGEWFFYRKVYDFASYEDEQQSMPHIKMMAEATLIERLGYQKIEQYSTPGWWTLRKPIR